MDNNINSIVIDKEEFTIEDAREAAKNIFNVEAQDFYALKDEKWYKHLISAITFGADRKKKVIKDIRSLAKLQSIFMTIYCENYQGLDTQLNDIIDNLSQTNTVVKKLYFSCIAKIRPQERIEDLSQLDKNYLLLLLSAYKSTNGKENEFKDYRVSAQKSTGIIGLPDSDFDPEQLEKVSSVETFYRCITEMRIIDGTEEFPDNIASALDNLNISKKSMKNIEKLVIDEVECFGKEYLLDKHNCYDDDIEEDIEFEEESSGETVRIHEKKMISANVARDFFSKYLGYKRLETENYIVVSIDGKLLSYDKETGLAEDIYKCENADELIDNCVALSNCIYFFKGQTLACIDLCMNQEKTIAEANFVVNEHNSISDMYITQDGYILLKYYDENNNYVLYKINVLESVFEKVELCSVYSKRCTDGNRIISADNHYSLKNDCGSKTENWYELSEYIPAENKNTILSDSIHAHVEKMANLLKDNSCCISSIDVHDRYLNIIIKDTTYRTLMGLMTGGAIFDSSKVYSYTFDMSSGAEIKNKHLGDNIEYLRRYSHYLIYVDVNNKYSLTVYDYLEGKTKIIVKDYMVSEKSGLKKSVYADNYPLLDEWIYYKTHDGNGRKLVSIKDFMEND